MASVLGVHSLLCGIAFGTVVTLPEVWRLKSQIQHHLDHLTQAKHFSKALSPQAGTTVFLLGSGCGLMLYEGSTQVLGLSPS